MSTKAATRALALLPGGSAFFVLALSSADTGLFAGIGRHCAGRCYVAQAHNNLTLYPMLPETLRELSIGMSRWC
jgi:hypothetical protein